MANKPLLSLTLKAAHVTINQNGASASFVNAKKLDAGEKPGTQVARESVIFNVQDVNVLKQLEIMKADKSGSEYLITITKV